MKKIAIFLLFIPFLLGACQQKNKSDNDLTNNIETEEESNPYISDDQEATRSVPEEDLSGNVIALSSNDFIARITEIDDQRGFRYKGNTPCIVDFYADWCRPCMSIKPMMKKLANKYKGKLIIYSINVDNAQDVCSAFGIQNIPTLMFFNTTDQPKQMVGAPSESELEKAIQDFLN